MATAFGNRPLDGQVALVTGASRGIGAATAKALAAAGAHVVITGRNAALLEEIEESIHQAGGSATIAPLDLGEPDAIARLATAISNRWDALDIMVLSAAFLPQLGPVTQIEPRYFNQALTTNVLATQALIAAFDPMLKRSKDARIVGLTSSLAQAPRPYWGAYAASKAAFEALLECHGQEVARISEIRVAILDPGATRTAMRARAYPGEDPQTVKAPEVVADRIVALVQEDFPTCHRERVQPAG
ncbi:oxidoreductase [Erythrobacter sp. SG61-1L]|uniref:SDR family NAD(P)-dependent oxidoreductase n=1 Tax=Erythrobacter sp. SG61-1L TaxID=1603897 RepID=UPI0006C8FE3D|nr:SDR family NAD(P)-dependent oxidoreductase [Erythrobacter sp. SG61-1L]KPL67787.1 oxidoreductase [Erythrobacter sp. SG61-1L]